MKGWLNLKLFLAGLFALGAIAQAQHEPLLFQGNYALRANVDYTTNLYRVYGAPVNTGGVKIRFSGSQYCDIRVNTVQYTTASGDFLRTAIPSDDGTYEIREGVIHAIQINFRQVYWDGVSCSIAAYAADAGGPVEGHLLGAITYSGGFVDKSSLPVDESRLRGFRLAIPAFCRGVEVLRAGTVVDGVYYSATKVGRDRFRSHVEGANNVSRLLITLNGPKDLECDIPVYKD